MIGNAAYSRGRLRNPLRDAQRVAASFRAVEMSVTVHEDLDLAGMERALSSFVASLDPNDQAVVYYAGHAFELMGSPGREQTRENYLIPVDFEAQTEGRARDRAYSL